MDAQADERLLVGRVYRPHGVAGELKVIPETDNPERFEDLTAVFTGRNAERREIESVRFQATKRGPLVVLKLSGIDSREEAEGLRGADVFAAATDLPPLEQGEFFLHDLVGLDVVTEEGEFVGVIDDVLRMPAQDVIVVGRSKANPAMIPAVPEIVREIDLDASRVVIRPIEGLLD